MEIDRLTRTWLRLGLLAFTVCVSLFLTPRSTLPQEIPKVKPYVVLSEEFFTAMEKLAKSGATYGDRQEPLLEQIALASQYIVKTNLTLVRQNERIIQLLEELNRRPGPVER